MKYTTGWSGQVTAEFREDATAFPFAVNGLRVLVAFAVMDSYEDKFVVIVNECSTPHNPDGRDNEDSVDGYVVLAVRPDVYRLGQVAVTVIADGDAYMRALNRAAEAAYMNEG